MKILEKIALVVYSYIVLCLSIIACALAFGWLKTDVVANVLQKIVSGDVSAKITIGTSIVLILLSIKCIFFGGKRKEEEKKGILLQNDNGKLLITKETIDNLTLNVVKEFDDIEQVTTKASVDKDNNLVIYVNLEVGTKTIVKELSNSLQFRIIETVKNVLDLEVKQVNIRINDFAKKQEKKIQENT